LVNSDRKRRRGRPKSEAKHREILAAAGESFLEHGLEGTSMDLIAERAGVSKQTVYSHFNSKTELFQAVIRHKCDQHRLASDLPDAEGMSLSEGLYEITRRYLDLALDPAVIAMHRQVAAQSRSSSEMARLFVAAGPAPTIRTVAEFLRSHQRHGRLGDGNCESLAADYIHETAARYKFEMLINLRDSVDTAEREAHARRRVREFLAVHGRLADAPGRR
jgi:TetR/AcrR family transcriptional repressor of mexJK operon